MKDNIVLMRIHIGESDKWQGKPLYKAIVELLRMEGFRGATVLRGIMGFGGSSIIHTSSILRLSEDLPVVIEVIDEEEKINRILPILDSMIEGGIVTLERVKVVLDKKHPS